MQNKVTCIIVDDEPNAVALLRECLKELYSNIEVIDTYSTWDTALRALRKTEFDLLFIDVSMPGKSGMDILALIPQLTAEVIFVTAHSEFALKAYVFSPSGYVLKPIEDKQLSLAVDKALERISYKKLAKQTQSPPPLEAKIGISNNKGIDYFAVNDVFYLEAMNNCTRIVTRTGEITSSYSLGRFKTIMEKHAFYPVHRSYFVNLNCITRYAASGVIIMANGDEIPVSKNIREDFLHHFDMVTRNT